MLKQIHRRIHRFSSDDPKFFPASYCYYIPDSRRTLVDTSMDPGMPHDIPPGSVDMILNTHYHRDHTGCNHFYPDAALYCHPLDRAPIESIEAYIDRFGLTAHPELQEDLLRVVPWHSSQELSTFDSGQHLSLGEIELEVLHTPGHTRGHCGFYWREEGILFSGDIDLTGFGPWYGHPESDLDQLLQSIETLINLQPAMILSSHHEPVADSTVEYLKQYLEIVQTREMRILEKLSQPMSLEELTLQHFVYEKWRRPQALFRYFEQNSMRIHLRRLLRQGLVFEANGLYQSTL